MTINAKPGKYTITLLCLAATGAWATEFGTVVSSTPVVASVPVAQRQCFDEPVVYQQRPSGAGALIGAIAGAAIGNSIGSGAGRAAATGIGLIAGSEIGNRVEADASQPVTSTVQRCRNVTSHESRIVAYDVVYDYQGVRRSVRLAQDPGDQIALQVQVTPLGAQAPGRMAEAPPAQGYSAPADEPYENYGQALPPRVIYDAPRPAVYINPWPYVVIGRGWNGGGWYGDGGNRGHRR